jgi:hypothetical protein
MPFPGLPFCTACGGSVAGWKGIPDTFSGAETMIPRKKTVLI